MDFCRCRLVGSCFGPGTLSPALLLPLPLPHPTPRFKDSRSSTLVGDPYINHDNGTLEIHTAQPHNSGKYTCVAGNNLGIYENHVYLEVKGETQHLATASGSKSPCVRWRGGKGVGGCCRHINEIFRNTF